MLELLVQLFKTVLQLFLVLLNPVFLIFLIIIILVYAKRMKDYKDSAYYQVTKAPYLSIRHDLGKWGEYLTYRHLKKFENDGAKFLFNVYIPKENGETTEIDVLMISKKGIFVFESKNYSGWIFGSEKQKNWYQTLPEGRGKSHKEHFYNPIMQNRSHIKHLKAFIGEEITMYSIIVFSERCTLKNSEVKSADISVIKRNEVLSVVSRVYSKTSEELLAEVDVMNIYNKLYPYTQSSEDVKKQHIVNIQSNLAAKSSMAAEEVDSVMQKESEESHIKEKTVSEPSIEISSELEKDPKETNEILSNNENGAESVEIDMQESQDYKCPRCGENLILRTASRGANAGNQFWGCENFPKCRYIRNTKK